MAGSGPHSEFGTSGAARISFRMADYKSDRGIDVACDEAIPDRPGELLL
jgi:hypothetical protein